MKVGKETDEGRSRKLPPGCEEGWKEA